MLADEVTHTETAQLGPVLVGWEIWKRLAMPAVLKELGLNRSQRQAAAISVIIRKHYLNIGGMTEETVAAFWDIRPGGSGAKVLPLEKVAS